MVNIEERATDRRDRNLSYLETRGQTFPREHRHAERFVRVSYEFAPLEPMNQLSGLRNGSIF